MEVSERSPCVVGGLFGLVDPVPAKENLADYLGLQGAPLLLAHARCGIRLLVQSLRPGTVWMPSYLCPSMVLCLDDWESLVRFFPVDCGLRITDLSWLSDVRQGDLVCVIDYFGCVSSLEVKKALRCSGAIVLEDACQAMLTGGIGEEADYLLFSPRKFVGVPDGGVLVPANGAPLADVSLDPPPREWWLELFAASLWRRDFDQRGGGDNDRRWFDSFRRAEERVPAGVYGMSSLTRYLLGCVDHADTRVRRRENWLRLYDSLGQFSLFPRLAENEVPLGFVVRFPSRHDRETARQALFQARIYPSVHWQIGGVVPGSFATSHVLAETIMTIPCDQRYGAWEMDQVIGVLRPCMRHTRMIAP